jgi:Cu/Ag efflux pump CusA
MSARQQTLVPLCSSTWLFLIFAAGCRHDDHAHPYEPDDHEDKTAQRTIWSDRFEIFLEHKLIAAGTPTTFVTHVTDLEKLEPRRAGPVKFVLQFGADAPLEHLDPVAFDRPALARYALKIEAVARTLEAALQGVTVSRVLEGRNSFDLVVRITEEEAWSPHTIGDLLVDTPAGPKVPLRALARIAKETGPNTVSRENVERKIVVMCNVAGRDVASVVEDSRKLIEPIVASGPGYRVEYGGQFEAGADAGRFLAILGVAVIIAVGFLLHLAFRSARDALLVMVNLALALIGGVAGVFVSGGVLSVASLIGFITVFGIATRNGIMLVSS